jgi:hypothetical protein
VAEASSSDFLCLSDIHIELTQKCFEPRLQRVGVPFVREHFAGVMGSGPISTSPMAGSATPSGEPTSAATTWSTAGQHQILQGQI